MTTLQALKDDNHISDEELHEITKFILNSFIVRGQYKNEAYVAKKESLISSFTEFIEQYLALHFTGTRERKLQLIKFISKLNMQKELLELASGATNLDDIKKAGKRLGKKSQSAFEGK